MTLITQNDFLNPLFSLNPIIVALIILFLDFSTLALVAIKTRTIKSVLFKIPAVLLGDFFLIPFTGFLITYFYQNTNTELSILADSIWTTITAFLAIIITVVFGLKFNLIKTIWIPHGIFFWFMAYIVITFISKGFYLFLFERNVVLLSIWISVCVCIFLHQMLGLIWPKKFTKK